jgi:competence protein ComEC
MRRNRLLESAPLFMPAIAFIAGIVTGDHWGEPAFWWVLLAVIGTVCLLARGRAMLQSVLLYVVLVALGGVRSSTVRQQHDNMVWPDGMLRYEGVIVGETAEKEKTVAADVVIANNGHKIKCYVAKDSLSQQLQVGDRISISSYIGRNSEWRRGAFDYRRYLEVHGFSGQTFVRKGYWQPAGRSWQGLNWWQRTKLHFLCYRHTLLKRYQQLGTSHDQYAVLAAMTLGDKSAMPHELKEIYAVSGASHVLALSGLHLGIIYFLLSLLILGQRLRIISLMLVISGIWAFVLLVGMQPSVVRAAVMISVFALLSLVNRSRMSLNALSLTAIILLLVSPDSIYDVGFQLSFMAMLAILTIQPLLEKLIPRKFLFNHPVVRWAWGVTTVSVAAQIGVAPLVAYYFGRFSTYFLLTNFVAIPAVIAILWLALASLLLSFVWPLLIWLVTVLNSTLSFIADHMPGASIEGLHPSALQTAMIYVIILSVYLIVLRYDQHY